MPPTGKNLSFLSRRNTKDFSFALNPLMRRLSSTLTPNVVWSRRAEARLADVLTKMPEHTGTLDQNLETIRHQLEVAFPDAAHVIVLNYFVGFKPCKNEHILQVDVRRAGSANSYVVKLADHDKLNLERNAWNLCNITDPNPVFMSLLAFPDGGNPGKLIAIAYQDANHFIGIEDSIWLESAVLRCVRFDSPVLDSIREVLHDIYSQLGLRLHKTYRLESAGPEGIQTMPNRQQPGQRHHLLHSMTLWERGGPRSVRQQVNAAFAVGFPQLHRSGRLFPLL